MKLFRSLITLSLVLSVLVVAAPARAATVSDCQVQISTLRTQTQNATFIGQHAAKDQAGLVGKLDAASSDLAAGKNADAIQKLSDFRTKVESLNAQSKISSQDADTLIARANDTIACIQSLST